MTKEAASVITPAAEMVWRKLMTCEDDRYFGSLSKLDKQLRVLSEFEAEIRTAALTTATATAEALRAEVEAKNDLLRECLRWLPLLDSHEAGSTTDLLCDRIRTALPEAA